MKLKCQLQHATVTPNGHAHSIAKPMSQRQIFNVLSMLGTMFQWALRTDIRRLPAHWINPLTRELIGAKPTKDPIRRLTMNDEYLLQLIQHCDAWQLTHLALSFVYPLRPEEAVGLLVEEVDFSKRELRFGSRFGGDDYTKGKQSFVLPVPPELTPILSHLVNGRHHGPLLRQRRHYTLPSESLQPDTIENGYRAMLMVNQADVITAQDRKRYLRRTLSQFGGITPDVLTKEFKTLMRQAGVTSKIRLYDLRSLNSTRLYQSDVNHLACRYFTGHAANDIMNSYVALQPHKDIQPYFLALQPVLQAITKRYQELRLGVTV
ncbi:MAG: site-specific integrase [Gemmatales bacterium]